MLVYTLAWLKSFGNQNEKDNAEVGERHECSFAFMTELSDTFRLRQLC